MFMRRFPSREYAIKFSMPTVGDNCLTIKNYIEVRTHTFNDKGEVLPRNILKLNSI